MEPQESRSDDARSTSNSGDRLRGFLAEHGLVPADAESERDERIFNAGMTCVELAMQPYERRLVRRASHDAERVDALLVELHGRLPAIPDAEIFTPASYREFVNIIERDLHPRGDGGPVPVLFRTGAFLIAASYNPADETIARCAQRDLMNLKATLQFLDDLLDWIEAGRRGDRLETLQEARNRLDAMDQQVSRQHDMLRNDLKQLAASVEASTAPSPELSAQLERMSAMSGDRLASLESAIASVRDSVTGMREESAGVVTLEERLAGLEARLDTAAASHREALDSLAERMKRDIQAGSGEPASEALAQLRSLVLAGLAATAIVAILVVVAISML
jgi:hypothetical protein